MVNFSFFGRLKLAAKSAFNAYTGRFTTLDADGFPVFTTTTASGLAVSADRALYATAVFACVNLLSSVIASIPLTLIRREPDGDNQPAADHPVTRLLAYKPNDYMTPYAFWLYNLECILLRGGFISWMNRLDSGRVVSLHPLHPDTVERRLTDSGQILISGFSQWGPGKYLRFKDEPIADFFWTNYRTNDGINPVSLIKYAAESIGMALAAEEHGARVFQNDATPPLVIQHPEKLSPEHLANLAKMWRKGGSGDNYGMPRFVDGGAKIERIAMSNEDAQYIESRRFQREDICGIFRVRPSMIGDTARAQGWSTLEQLNAEFLTYTLNPYLENIEQAVRSCLLQESEWGTIIPHYETRQLLRTDIAARSEYYRNLYNMGAISPNEIRHAEGLNSRDGGNEYVRPGSMVMDADEDHRARKPEGGRRPKATPDEETPDEAE